MPKRAEPDQDAIEALLDWMIDGAPPFDNPHDIIGTMCQRLQDAGIPICRFVLFIYTLHPNIKGRRFKWQPETGVDMVQAGASVFTSDLYHHNPLPHIIDSGKPVRRHLSDPNCPDDYIIISELRSEGATDYYAQPLRYINGEVNVATWATKQPDGFSIGMISVLDRISKPLARLTEAYLLYLNAGNLLSTYVGRQVGHKILEGSIDRGSGENIEAAILFADLKRFTETSNTVSGETIIASLNSALDALVPAVEENGGEILKFMGDGFFAIFPIGKRATKTKAAINAICAVKEGLAALDRQNDADNQTNFIQFGVRTATHVGSFYYGNIGGSSRMDFTAIGPDVNFTARLLGSATDFDCDHVVSEAISELQPKECDLLGTAKFKGFEQEHPVFELKIPSPDAALSKPTNN